jgi:hypothetical protein
MATVRMTGSPVGTAFVCGIPSHSFLLRPAALRASFTNRMNDMMNAGESGV